MREGLKKPSPSWGSIGGWWLLGEEKPVFLRDSGHERPMPLYLCLHPFSSICAYIQAQAGSTKWSWWVLKRESHEFGRGSGGDRKGIGGERPGRIWLKVHCSHVWNPQTIKRRHLCYAVVIHSHKIISSLLHNCDLVAVVGRHVSIWSAGYLIGDLQRGPDSRVENHGPSMWRLKPGC